jgi:hypothetical protein
VNNKEKLQSIYALPSNFPNDLINGIDRHLSTLSKLSQRGPDQTRYTNLLKDLQGLTADGVTK